MYIRNEEGKQTQIVNWRFFYRFVYFQRNHNQIKPLVVLLALSSICAFLNVLKFTPYGISSGLIYGFIYGYLFVCVYSLFYKIRAEFDGGLEYQPINPWRTIFEKTPKSKTALQFQTKKRQNEHLLFKNIFWGTKYSSFLNKYKFMS